MDRKISRLLSSLSFLLLCAGFLSENVTHAAPVATVRKKGAQTAGAVKPAKKSPVKQVHGVLRDGLLGDWGIAVQYVGCRLLVAGVLPKSRARVLHIAVGDEIVEINQLPIQNYKAEEIEKLLRESMNTFTVARGKRKLTFRGYSRSPVTADAAPKGTSALRHGDFGAGTNHGDFGAGTRHGDFGAGTSQGDLGAGSAEGPVGGVIATRLPIGTTVSRGNIAPYRKDMLERIAQNWHPRRTTDLIVVVTIAKDGSVVGCEIFQSSGDKKIDKEAVAIIEAMEFAPLPDFFKGEQLPFKIELNKEVALNTSDDSPSAHAQQTQHDKFQSNDSIVDFVLRKAKGNWQRHKGPVVQFKISNAPAQISIAKTSGDDKLDSQALNVFNHVILPSFSADTRFRRDFVFSIDLANKSIIERNDRR
jgi:TonB family protein